MKVKKQFKINRKLIVNARVLDENHKGFIDSISWLLKIRINSI